MPRIDIRFQVRNLSVEKLSYDTIPAGNSNYIYAVFDVDEVWQQIERPMAVYTVAGKSWMAELSKARDGSLEVRVPFEAMAKPGEMEVGLRGGNRLVTDRARVRVIPGADPDAMPSGDSVEDWVSKVERTIEEKMQQARNDAVDQLAPPFHQIAPVVQGRFVAGHPLGVVSHIRPVQDGEGDPSPENVRPIHGHRELTLTKCGKNLFNKALRPKSETSYISETGTTIPSVPAYAVYEVSLIAGDYYVTVGVNSINSPAICFFDAQGQFLAGTAYNGRMGFAVKAPKNTAFARFTIGNLESDQVHYNLDKFQIAVGTKPTDYQSYDGETYTQKLPEEVFGGEFDWNAGKLTKWYKYQANAEKVSYVETSQPHGDRIDLIIDSIKAITGVGFCESLKYKTIIGADYNFTCNIRNIKSGVAIGIHLPKGTLETADIAGARKWINANKDILNFVFPIENGAVSLLENETVNALSGTTTLYSNTGDTEVTGRLDPNAVISGLMDRVDALEQFHTQI